jgi:hypothetical protein
VFFAVLINFIFTEILDLSCSLIAQVSYSCNKVSNAKVLSIFTRCVVELERVVKFS